MDRRQWRHINHFYPSENWGDQDLLRFELVQRLDWLRDQIGYPIYINNAAHLTGHAPNSFHYQGMAADIHCDEKIHLGDFFLAALSYFNGIGLYPMWNIPGLHVDVRSLQPNEAKALWIKWHSYHKLDIGELSMTHCRALRNQCLLLRDDPDGGPDETTEV